MVRARRGRGGRPLLGGESRHSITLSQAARQLYTQHSQIAIAYGPLPAAAAAADAVDAFERSLGELLQAQQAAVEALSSALVGAAEDALTRAAEGREKVNATTDELGGFLRRHLPALAPRFAAAALDALPAAAEGVERVRAGQSEAVAKAAAAGADVGAQLERWKAWGGRLDASLDDLRSAVDAPVALGQQWLQGTSAEPPLRLAQSEVAVGRAMRGVLGRTDAYAMATLWLAECRVRGAWLAAGDASAEGSAAAVAAAAARRSRRGLVSKGGLARCGHRTGRRRARAQRDDGSDGASRRDGDGGDGGGGGAHRRRVARRRRRDARGGGRASARRAGGGGRGGRPRRWRVAGGGGRPRRGGGAA